jgi:hypothetical protein
MPIAAIAVVLLDITLAVHVMRSRRPYYWIFIIFGFPLLGAIVYIVAELVPEMLHSPEAQRARRGAAQLVDPDREYRALVEALETADTVDNKRALAAEFVRRGQAADAVKLYQSALQGIHAQDPALLLGLARAQFAQDDHQASLDTLERLNKNNPRYRSPEAHLLYARSLESLGRHDEALTEYDAASRYFLGEEARCRHALLLQRLERRQEASALFTQIIRSAQKGGRAYGRAQREWVEVAQQNLGA